jgi:hypothetical protein
MFDATLFAGAQVKPVTPENDRLKNTPFLCG